MTVTCTNTNMKYYNLVTHKLKVVLHSNKGRVNRDLLSTRRKKHIRSSLQLLALNSI